MKKIFYTGIIITAVMLLLPLSVIKDSENILSVSAVQNIPKETVTPAENFKVCFSEDGKVHEMSAQDYIFGVVAAEMPALYETEALKAQAVAAYTFACCRKQENKEKSYDITTDPNCDQSYITKEKAREKWGSKADEYEKKIKNAVKEVSDLMIIYKGEPIVAVYHAVSSGKTESCADIWGNDLPYLVSVSSEGDKLADNYISQTSFTTAELQKKLSEEIDLTGEPENYFSNFKRTKAGTVKELLLCGKTYTGSRIRSLLGLRSSNFEIKFGNGKFTFTAYGYGHGVGMSQNGANYMAKQGSSFKEILTHYYNDCKVEKIS